ncbi:MAG: hypothetical protein RhofKO_24670 [Rhodothermales bacterium]
MEDTRLGMDRWSNLMVQDICSLRGSYVDKWIGAETAIIEGNETEPSQFVHSDVPCIQVGALYLRFREREPMKFTTYQDDDIWGIRISRVENNDELVPRSASGHLPFRTRHLPDLPAGHLQDVTVTSDGSSGVIAEVVLNIEGQDILLVAGEIYEMWDGGVEFARLDESILLFPDPKAAQLIEWRNP